MPFWKVRQSLATGLLSCEGGGGLRDSTTPKPQALMSNHGCLRQYDHKPQNTVGDTAHGGIQHTYNAVVGWKYRLG